MNEITTILLFYNVSRSKLSKSYHATSSLFSFLEFGRDVCRETGKLNAFFYVSCDFGGK